MSRFRLGTVFVTLSGLLACGGSALGGEHLLPLILSASNVNQPSASGVLQESFVRIINHSDEAAWVDVWGYDDAGESSDAAPVRLKLGAKKTIHLNSGDLENGNADKGLPEGLGPPTRGNWRLHLDSQQDIEPSAYVRTRPDGFLTGMSAVAPFRDMRHRVSIFNPASNVNQRSWLRLVNLSSDVADVIITGVDDDGIAAPGGEVRLSLSENAAVAVTAGALESGVSDQIAMTGRFGEKAVPGKWQLAVASDQPILVMSLLDTPTGHLSNLSVPKASSRVSAGAGPKLTVFDNVPVTPGGSRVLVWSEEFTAPELDPQTWFF